MAPHGLARPSTGQSGVAAPHSRGARPGRLRPPPAGRCWLAASLRREPGTGPPSGGARGHRPGPAPGPRPRALCPPPRKRKLAFLTYPRRPPIGACDVHSCIFGTAPQAAAVPGRSRFLRCSCPKPRPRGAENGGGTSHTRDARPRLSPKTPVTREAAPGLLESLAVGLRAGAGVGSRPQGCDGDPGGERRRRREKPRHPARAEQDAPTGQRRVAACLVTPGPARGHRGRIPHESQGPRGQLSISTVNAWNGVQCDAHGE